jgi:aromatic amino acid aminotransferase I
VRLANGEKDVVIVEDDPYSMLQFGEYRLGGSSAPAAPTVDVDAFVNSMEKSFMSIDYQGRVIRLDTFSKVSAGPLHHPVRCRRVPR